MPESGLNEIFLQDDDVQALENGKRTAKVK